MGAGFAFMGRQYHIEVSGDDYYIDILMYNTFLHRYLVIELKDTEFMPEYIGKLNFYCSAVDDILCREGDNRTIGLLLCKTKDRIKAEYALRDIQKPIGISDYELGQALPKDFRGSLPTIEEIEKACKVGQEMQLTAMRLGKAGVSEKYIAGQVDGVALSYGAKPSFPTILTQKAATLHIHSHDGILQDGNLVLNDCGAESFRYYCSDYSRSWPVSGKYTQQQREIYDIAYKSYTTALAMAKPGVTYMSVHYEACKVIFNGLKELGLTRGDADEAVAAGAHSLFFPCGLGHMMGMDVHDMENLGQIYVGYDDEVRPRTEFGIKSLRMGRRLEPGFVMTDEPGIYFIPELIDRWKADGTCKEFLNFPAIEKYRHFGGLRVEDDILITEDGSRFLGGHLINSADEIEEYIAQSRS